MTTQKLQVSVKKIGLMKTADQVTPKNDDDENDDQDDDEEEDC